MTTFTLISDTHGLHRKIHPPAADVLIHCGDCTTYGDLQEVANLNEWFGTLPFEHIVLTPGNHDWAFQDDPATARKLVTNAHLLIDESVTIDGFKIYGSPFTPRFYNWAFMLDYDYELTQKWSRIPDDTDVLVTHGPPHGKLDWSHYQKDHVGCHALRERIKEVRPMLHAFGHIHLDGGKAMEDAHTIYVNASVCDESYRPTNEILTIALEKNDEAAEEAEKDEPGTERR